MTTTKTPEKETKAAGKRVARGGQPKPLILVGAVLLLVLLLLAVNRVVEHRAYLASIENARVAQLARLELPPWVDAHILPKDCDSRRGSFLEDFGGIVIHYVGNPNTSAIQNRNYYANPGTEVNSHFVIGLEGEIVQCLPLEEKSSASSERNRDTISIEVCHPDEEGQFSEKTYEALIKLVAWLCEKGDLDPEQVIRHYDVTGKACPLYYVNHEEAWQQMQADIRAALEGS